MWRCTTSIPLCFLTLENSFLSDRIRRTKESSSPNDNFALFHQPYTTFIEVESGRVTASLRLLGIGEKLRFLST